jgi:outer membrane protein OmpA-like peptidoglycan-associated protein
MKRLATTSFLLLLFLSTIALQSRSEAQLRDFSYKIGIQTAHYVWTGNEFSDDGISLLFRPYLRFELSNYFQLGLGAGYGWFQGKDYGGNDYKTEIIPLDVRLLIMPFQFESWNPYLYLGGGVVNWWLDDSPRFPVRPAEEDRHQLDAFGEIGMGFEFALSPSWTLELSGGFNVINDDAVNGFGSNVDDDFLHEYDRYFNLGLGVAYAAESCDSDKDNDGLGRCEEEELGTDPYNADSDGDGLKDGEEVKKYNTDPLKADSDGDGLNDYEEVMNYETNPNKADTDGDGLNDYDELKKHKTDPNNTDTDGDGLNDGEEVTKYNTDPTKKDTDGDGLKDGDEVKIHKTNPTKVDTDGDGLNDGEEVGKYKTDPLDKDTDDGGVEDGVEVNTDGTNPLDGSDDGGLVPEFEHILFGFDSYKIMKSEESKLVEAHTYLEKNPSVPLLITGHTDSKGNAKYNMKLSVKRAQAAKDWLVKKGISADRIEIKGLGEDKPFGDNKTEEGRAKNRRAELIVDDMK